MFSPHQAAHGLTGPPSQYALIENARRARLRQTRAEYAAAMGALFAPFTRVAAGNPHAAAPTVRSAAELVTPSEANRPIADPYTRYIVAREKVNQGAARPADLGRRRAAAGHPGGPVGVPARPRRPARTRPARARRPVGQPGRGAGRPARPGGGGHQRAADLATIDLYSCFPAPVFNICDGLGLRPDDPRGLTVTGGLPFFGGAGNNYSMHAIAETVPAGPRASRQLRVRRRQRRHHEQVLGRRLLHRARGLAPDDSADLQAEIDGWPAIAEARHADGWATIETYTVKHRRDGARTGIVVGRLEADGRRFVARADDRDGDLLELLGSAEQPVGERVYARSFGSGNRVSASRARMSRLFPRRDHRAGHQPCPSGRGGCQRVRAEAPPALAEPVTSRVTAGRAGPPAEGPAR